MSTSKRAAHSSNWASVTFTYDFLKSKAGTMQMDLIKWLKDIGVVPAPVSKLNAPKVIRKLSKDAIPAGYVASMAYEWESYGGGATPEQFIKALAFDIKDSQESRVVEEVLNG